VRDRERGHLDEDGLQAGGEKEDPEDEEDVVRPLREDVRVSQLEGSEMGTDLFFRK
jgi:hypothetical protein